MRLFDILEAWVRIPVRPKFFDAGVYFQLSTWLQSLLVLCVSLTFNSFVFRALYLLSGWCGTGRSCAKLLVCGARIHWDIGEEQVLIA